MNLFSDFFDIKILILLSSLSIFSCADTKKNEIGTFVKPEDNRFTKVILAEELDEPMQFEFLDDGRVLFVERKGKIKFFNTKTHQTTIVGEIPVSIGYYSKTGEEISPTGEDGMQGVAVDPKFNENGFIYLYYSPKGGEHRSILTRYTLQADTLVHESKKILFTVNNQRESCCHLGGGMVFDTEGNLLLTTGDNTTNDPRGYAPLDDRPNRERFDSQRSSANTNSLRGKILRVHPEADGTYTIPEGNLFPKGTSKTRPEIYTMGNRNPWRLSIDSKTGYIYWGEVGPGGITDSIGMGPRSYDEFNVARKASNFGWPYFIANNKPYWEYDYETQKTGEKYDTLRPLNRSKNNTGLEKLPPAEPAMIWYPQSQAVDFPLLGSGSNSAVGGPIYHKSDFKNPLRPFPDYYEGKWFITDWTRGWIMAVSLNDDGGFDSMEEFFPGIDLSGPIDMDFGPDGDLYVLEYGRGPYMRNQGARLVRIEYTAGNRKPTAVVSASKIAGAVPFTVQLSSAGTIDNDGDELSYNWEITKSGNSLYTFNSPNPEVTLDEPGEYEAKLIVTDPAGLKSESTFTLFAGNAPPQIKFDLGMDNTSFFFPDETINYNVIVADEEDGSLEDNTIDPTDVALQIDYLSNDFHREKVIDAVKSKSAAEPFISILANVIINSSDCKSCHQVDKKLVGPSYHEISERYSSVKNVKNYLHEMISRGGSGKWEAEMAMPAHPSLSDGAINTIVEYILSLNQENKLKTLPLKGTFKYKIPPVTNGGVGSFKTKLFLKDKFLLRASYSDKGNKDAAKQSITKLLELRNPIIPVAFFDEFEDATINHSILPEFSTVIAEKSGAAMILRHIDVTGISKITLLFKNNGHTLHLGEWKIQIRLDGKEGELIGEINDTTISKDKEQALNQIASTALKLVDGIHDLFVVFVKDSGNIEKLESVQLRRVTFSRE